MIDKNQLSFFNTEPPKPKTEFFGNHYNGRKLMDPLCGFTEQQIQNMEQLKEWCFLYTSGRKCIIRFMMNRENAMRFCSSPKSKGCIHGNKWMYVFMCVWNWLDEMPYGKRKIKMFEDDDNNSYDWLIEELHCDVIRIRNIPDILLPLGVNVSVGEYRKPPKENNCSKPSGKVRTALPLQN